MQKYLNYKQLTILYRYLNKQVISHCKISAHETNINHEKNIFQEFKFKINTLSVWNITF